MAPSFHFKAVDSTTRDLVRHWLLQPHVSEWFYGQGLENTLRHLQVFSQGQFSWSYWVAFDHSKPFAFLITSPIDKAHDSLAKWCREKGPAITLDLLIGEPSHLGKGFSSHLIYQFLVGCFPTVQEVLIDPEATNTRAIHVYQKVGFKTVGTFIPSHSPHPHLMMHLAIKEMIPPLG